MVQINRVYMRPSVSGL